MVCCYGVADGPRSVSISPRGLRRIAHGNIMTCSSEGNPQPSYHWTAVVSDLDSVTTTTITGAELVVDLCNLTAWNHRSERRNVSGTTRLMLTCHAENTVRGQRRTESSTREVYSLSLTTNMDELCTGEFFVLSSFPHFSSFWFGVVD